MRPIARAALVGAAVATCAVPALGAVTQTKPTLNTSARCYAAHERVQFAVGGLRPRARWRARVRGRVVDAGRVSRGGGLLGAFRAPAPRHRPGVLHFTLSVTDGTHTVHRRLGATRFGADYHPAVHSPRTRVRFVVAGFPAREPVYLHYVTPRHHLRRTVLLGRTGAPCGTLRSRRRPVFPFSPGPGRWRMQFDTRRDYSPRAVPHARLVLTLGRASVRPG